MMEVTRHNFEDIYPKIEYSMSRADFIAVDTEFSGLYIDELSKPSILDSSEERYQKLKRSVESFTVLQIGISLFTGNVNENRYHSNTFTFHLCPMPLGSSDERFCFQSSSIRFLCKHNFDFNKGFRSGLSYMNNVQELKCLEDLATGVNLGENDFGERGVQELCSYVAAWLSGCKLGDLLTLPLSEGSSSTYFVVHYELRKRFPQVWTSIDTLGQMVVERVSSEQRQVLEKTAKHTEQEETKKLLNECLGFTQVFRLMKKAKKPIVGHNILMDLMFMYQKFHQPLPVNLNLFKQELHKIFPEVFDTKHIFYSVRKMMTVKLGDARSLEDLHSLVNSKEVLCLSLMQPEITKNINTETDSGLNHPHQAGYDAFLCGGVFLRLCHFLHFKNVSSMEVAPCSFRTYLSSMKQFCNSVNLIRAVLHSVRLDGPELPSTRPPLLHVTARSCGIKLKSVQLVQWFSVHGTIDVRLINSREALVAVSSHFVASEILQAFKNHQEIRVTKYRFWQHSQLGKSIRWGSFIAVTGACALLLLSAMR